MDENSEFGGDTGEHGLKCEDYAAPCAPFLSTYRQGFNSNVHDTNQRIMVMNAI